MGIHLWCYDLRNPEHFRLGEKWHLAKTVTEAIRILDTQDVEEIALDHDICWFSSSSTTVMPQACPETFEPVARFIVRLAQARAWNGTIWNPKVSIHTSNPDGARRMALILSLAGIEAAVRMETAG